MNDLDTMVQDIAESTGRVLPTEAEAKSEKKITKSQRIRDYFEDNPEIRNKDVVAALGHFGVTAADVANVKAAVKRKTAKKQSQVKRVSQPPQNGTPQSTTTPFSEEDDSVAIGLDVLEMGIEFVKKSGGISEAMYVLNVIKRIRSI
ncbi:MAG: hypothetical protein AAF664_16355 [Planctomycetota bacterium]